MITQLPIEIVDQVMTFSLLTLGYLRSIEVGIIVYHHPQGGTIGLRGLDAGSTKVFFSYPNYPRLAEVLPIHDASRIEGAKLFRGEEYPLWALTKLLEEFERRVETRHDLVKFLEDQLHQEERRLREHAAAVSSADVPKNGPPAEDLSPQSLPAPKLTLKDLSKAEMLILAWVNRDKILCANMKDFLYKYANGLGGNLYVTKDEFKEMLRQAGMRGMLVKVKDRWKPAPGYADLRPQLE